MCTHEQFIGKVATAGVAFAGPAHRRLLDRCKLTYGIGSMRGVRGVTCHAAWTDPEAGEAVPLVEVAARSEENPVQLAGTTLHELGHVLAAMLHGRPMGHGPEWKEACALLGLIGIDAAGTVYSEDNFDPKLLRRLQQIATPSDGMPNWEDAFGPGVTPGQLKPRPCTAGIGTRGGKSRGVGSGSRMIKAACPVEGYTIRLSRHWANQGLPHCPLCETQLEMD